MELESSALLHSHQHGDVSGVSSPVRAAGQGLQRTQRSRESDGFPSAMRALAREERLLHPKEGDRRKVTDHYITQPRVTLV